MTFVFVRHGESVANREGWLAGTLDTPLTPCGRDQALQLRSRLPPLARAFSSDLARARETGLILLEGTDIGLDETPLLRERHLGPWAQRRREDLPDPDDLIGWDSAPSGAESQADVAARVVPWLASLPEAPGNTLIVSHGGVIRVLVGLLDGTHRDAIGMRKVGNCEMLMRHAGPECLRELLQ